MKNWLTAIIMVIIAVGLITNGALYYQSNASLRGAQADITGVNQVLSALTTGINNLQNQVADTSSAVNGIRTQLADTSSSIEALRSETVALIAESSNLTSQVTTLKDQLASSVDEITTLAERAAKLEAQSQATVESVKKALPSVVFISVKKNTGQTGAGSGVILRSDGYILTNRHVVDNARSVEVTLQDWRTYQPTAIWTDDILDIAVVKIKESGLPTLSFGDPDQINVGDSVIAVGHALGLSPREGGATVTEGIVSNLGRSFVIGNTAYYDVIQTSAAINPGNSGGPLVNMAGEFIGLNSAAVVGAQNIGFAINVATAGHIFDDLVKYGKPMHPYLGVVLGDVSPYTYEGATRAPLGALVATLEPGEPAYEVGLRENDIITGFGGTKLDSATCLLRALWRHDVGDKVEVVFWRGGAQMKTEIVLALRPPKCGRL